MPVSALRPTLLVAVEWRVRRADGGTGRRRALDNGAEVKDYRARSCDHGSGGRVCGQLQSHSAAPLISFSTLSSAAPFMPIALCPLLAVQELNVDGLRVFFPFPKIYKEQFDYMLQLKVWQGIVLITGASRIVRSFCCCAPSKRLTQALTGF